MDKPEFWTLKQEAIDTLKDVPDVDPRINTWDNVDIGVSERFTIATGIAWFDGAVLPLVYDKEKEIEYCEHGSKPWDGPHVDFCNGEKTEANLPDCVCIKSYCRNLLVAISNEIIQSEFVNV